MRLKPLILLAALLATGTSALARDGRIHRCVGENGEPTFSDRKCTPAESAPASLPPTAPPTGAIEPAGPVMPATTQTCARSPDDLRDRVIAALETRSGVGFSGLFLWDGFGYGSSLAPLQELAELIAEPLISVELEFFERYGRRDRYSDPPSRGADVELLELAIRTVAEQERQVPYESTRRFELTEVAGCWWLLPPY